MLQVLLTLGVSSAFHFSPSKINEVISNYGLIGTYLMINDVESLFKCLLAICVSYFVTCPSVLLMFNRLSVFLLFMCGSLLHVLSMRPLSNIWFANIFSQSVACLFIFLIMSFTELNFALW